MRKRTIRPLHVLPFALAFGAALAPWLLYMR